MPASIPSASVLAVSTVLLILTPTCTQSVGSSGWCDWLPWTCATRRTPTAVAPGSSYVECELRRSRYCCATDPPTPTGGSAITGCHGNHEEWQASPYNDMRCRSSLLLGWAIVPNNQAVNACSTAYPRFRSTSATASSAWCPWEYWESWQYPTAGSCRSQQVRRRRCECPLRRGAAPPATPDCPGYPSASAETHLRSAGCGSWCSWSDWDAASSSLAAAAMIQRRRTCSCDVATAGDLGASGCRLGEADIATLVTAGAWRNSTRIDDSFDFSSRRVSILAGCLVVLVVGAATIAAGVMFLLLCKKKLWWRSSATSHWRHRHHATIGVSVFATTIGAAEGPAVLPPPVPLPTVAEKVPLPELDEADDGAPPPYTSQPELPRSEAPPPAYLQWAGAQAW